MQASKSVLVVGATGNQGGAVARALLADGRQVRALTRHSNSPSAQALSDLGAEIVVADLTDEASLLAATTGMDGVYVMTNPDPVDPDRELHQGLALFDAAGQAGARQIVFASAASTDDPRTPPHFARKRQLEEHLRSLDVAWTILAPVSFLSMVVSSGSWTSIRDGKFVFPLPTPTPTQVVALEDLAQLAALVFAEPDRFHGHRIEVASDELTLAAMAETLAGIVGRPVQHVAPPIDAIRAAGGADVATLLTWLADVGWQVDIPALHRDVPEIAWHSFADWTAAQAQVQ